MPCIKFHNLRSKLFHIEQREIFHYQKMDENHRAPKNLPLTDAKMYAIIISSTYKILQNDAESGKELLVMWICPNCQNQCETPYCPLCGYQMPTQYSEISFLEEHLKKMKKLTIAREIFFWILLGVLTVFTVVCITEYGLGPIVLLLECVIGVPLLYSILASKHTVKLWQQTINFLKNNRL